MKELHLSDEGYPEQLKHIASPPDPLYLQGTLPSEPMLAIVGSRRGSNYGRDIAHSLAVGLAEACITVVSGLARGIDAAAHRGALDGKGKTVAVLPAGLYPVYPPQHAGLAREIVEQGGGLVSEMPSGTVPLPGRFPVRNRIISGLCSAVIVVEAAQQSGALITARMALDEGRDVMAVPGSIHNPYAVGTHELIKRGWAALITSVEDVFNALPELAPKEPSRARTRAHARARARADSAPQDPELAAVWELLDWVQPRNHDDLAASLGIGVQEVSKRLTLLEMGNYIIGDDLGGVLRAPTAHHG
jgi:DNA processing protein